MYVFVLSGILLDWHPQAKLERSEAQARLLEEAAKDFNAKLETAGQESMELRGQVNNTLLLDKKGPAVRMRESARVGDIACTVQMISHPRACSRTHKVFKWL